jgi:hypothetical protein
MNKSDKDHYIAIGMNNCYKKIIIISNSLLLHQQLPHWQTGAPIGLPERLPG